MEERIAVVGLGYVGLPLAVALGTTEFAPILGYDINTTRVAELNEGNDRTGEISAQELKTSNVTFTSDHADLQTASFIIIAVPTPITAAKTPDLTAVKEASRSVGRYLKRGTVVVFESTVYPGVTEEICGPIIEQECGRKRGSDWWLGYSPERINPGDHEHTLQTVIKVVAGEDEETLNRMAAVYASVCKAGIHRAPDIKTAEAAKVIENTQRDLNIALVNELSMIFSRMGISTKAVLDAAATKWNFHRYSPGLVGGHCIGVDPYYLTYRAQELGYHPEVILAGRRINDSMGKVVAEQTIQAVLLAAGDQPRNRMTINVLGMTFKENVPDTRNSRVKDVISVLVDSGAYVTVMDPLLGSTAPDFGQDAVAETWDHLHEADATLLLVPHRVFLEVPLSAILRRTRRVIVDIKGVLDREAIEVAGKTYLTL